MRAAGRVVCLLLCLAACHDTPSASPHAAAATASRPHSPLAPAELRTTDGAIAIDNLQGQIDSEQRLAAYRPLTVTQQAAIADLIATCGQLLGRIADYERVDELAARLVHDAPTNGLSFLTRAKAHAIFHRFPAALRDLDEAERLGIHGRQVESPRAAVLQALGRYDEALAFRQRAAADRPDITTLTAEATVHADRGELDAAERLFIEAQYHYRDVSPFPVVWLYFQEGQMWMREGQLQRARELFAAAQLRLPAYAAAQGHLAEVEAGLGNRERAIALLRPLTETSDDPDYPAQLARILADAGRAEEASRWRGVAAARYEELMERHPEAFDDHAAEFWLAAGNDPERAFACAQRNLGVRQTPRAYELLLQAALIAQHGAVACEAATHTRALPHRWPSLQSLTVRAAALCNSPPA